MDERGYWGDRTFEMALSREGLGALFLEPKRRFMLLAGPD